MPHKLFVIRNARAYDLDAMVGLLRQLFTIEDDFTVNEEKQRQGLAALLADHNHGTIKVVEINGKVIGMCSAQINVSTAEGGLSALIEDFIVDADWRNQGVGTLLIDSTAKWAVDHGCVRLQLLADRRNAGALRLYKRLNWSTTHLVCLNRPTPLSGKETKSREKSDEPIKERLL